MPHGDLAIIVAAAVPEPSTRIAPIFVGDGGYGAILDAVDSSADRHFQILASAEKTLSIEDLEYLRVKGCFTLPARRAELLEAYFRFVHPTFPVIDACSFLACYASDGVEGINLLLLWSIFSVSASYVPDLEGGRKACKEAYIARAKLLFDLSHENDKIILVQSALLMSFWFADADDLKQGWYWTGVAFSIAQALGLHSELGASGSGIVGRDPKLLQTIWLCCSARDVWQAFGRGRPLRISTTVESLPLEYEIASMLTGLEMHGRLLYGPTEAREIGRMWRDFVAISKTLRDILVAKIPLSTANTERLQHCLKNDYTTASTEVLEHVDHHLQLHRCAAQIRLYKVTRQPEKVSSAADDMTALLRSSLSNHTVPYTSPVTVPLLVPAIVIYLDALKIGGTNADMQLSVYKEYLTAIEDNYPATTMLKRVTVVAETAIMERRVIEARYGTWSADVDLGQGDFMDLSWLNGSGLLDTDFAF